MGGFEDWTMEDVNRHNARIKNARIKEVVPKINSLVLEEKQQEQDKKSKYRANKCVVDDIEFDSEKEASRYTELKLLEKAGVITELRLQVPFVLQDAFEINGEKIQAIKYIADFTYYENGKLVIEDVKGIKTPVYNMKKKMFMYKYKQYIREV